MKSVFNLHPRPWFNNSKDNRTRRRRKHKKKIVRESEIGEGVSFNWKPNFRGFMVSLLDRIAFTFFSLDLPSIFERKEKDRVELNFVSCVVIKDNSFLSEISWYFFHATPNSVLPSNCLPCICCWSSNCFRTKILILKFYPKKKSNKLSHSIVNH